MSYSGEVLADSPIMYLRMDEASGLPQDSSAGGTHDAYATWGPDMSYTYSETGAITTEPSSTSIRFNNGSMFLVADHADFDLTDTITIEAWVKREADGVERSYIDHGTNSYLIQVLDTNIVRFVKSGVSVLCYSSNTLTADGLFHHIVAAKDGSEVKLYIDNVDVTTGAANVAFAATTDDLAVGGNLQGLGTSQWDGWLDEVAIYSTKLSAARVAAHYVAGTATDFFMPAARRGR